MPSRFDFTRHGMLRFLVAFSAVWIFTAGGSRASPLESAEELAGSFVGELPCADCPGIHYQLDLLGDHVFFLRMSYLGKDDASDDIGTWTLSTTDGVLVLHGGREEPLRFALRDKDSLRMLDRQGQEIRSALNYDLKRDRDVVAIEPRLVMDGMYRYLADAGLFTECLTRLQLPVAQEADNAALEVAYGEMQPQPGQELKVTLVGRIAMRPKMEGEGLQPMLVVDEFQSTWPRETCGAHLSTAGLENTYWRLTRLGGAPVVLPPDQREPHLVLHTEDHRAAGFSGCNRFTGEYRLEGDNLRFGRFASTRMACVGGMEIEQAFLKALTETRAWKIAGEHLELFGNAAEPIARFEATYLK